MIARWKPYEGEIEAFEGEVTSVDVHSMEITPAMLESVMTEGTALFSRQWADVTAKVKRWIEMRLPSATAKVTSNRPQANIPMPTQRTKDTRLASMDAVLIDRVGERPAVLAANWAVMDTTREIFADQGSIAGLAIGAIDTATLRAGLDAMATRAPINQKRAIQALLAQVNQANEQNAGRGLTVVDATPELESAEAIRTTLKQELAHWQQFELGKSSYVGT